MELNGTICLCTKRLGDERFTPRELLASSTFLTRAHTKVERKYFIKAYRHSGTTSRRIHKTKSISSTGFLILSGVGEKEKKE